MEIHTPTVSNLWCHHDIRQRQRSQWL